MFKKLVFSNIKKSFKDYTIYFITLLFGVCLFYVFNSMESQEKMLALNDSTHQVLVMLTDVMSYVSIFISVILGFLILYANKFLIRRRKKEFGLYMLLGMDKKKVSWMIVVETILIGIIAMVVGLVLGIFLSQGLAVLTASLMEVEIKQFTFTFSMAAALKSVLYFGIIFCVVIVFNSISISRYKLITLLTASRKNEKDRSQRIWLSVILFVLSCGIIGYAYHMLFSMLNDMQNRFVPEYMIKIMVVGAIGTIMLFYSMSGFVLKLVQKLKGIYYKGINMFTLRQLGSKISSTFVSISIICLMLLVAITTMAAGLGFAQVMQGDQEELLQNDMSYWYHNENHENLLQFIEENKKDSLQEVAAMSQVDVYNLTDLDYSRFLDDSIGNIQLEEIKGMNAQVIGVGQYNKYLKSRGQDEIHLEENQVAILCNVRQMKEMFENYIDSEKTIPIAGVEASVYPKLLETSYCNEMVASTAGVFVLPDNLLELAQKSSYMSYVNMDYKEHSQKVEDQVIREMAAINNKLSQKGIDAQTNISRLEAQTTSVSVKVVCSYFILYVGIVFLIASAAILGLQQMSEASDNVERYQLLSKLGTEGSMINHGFFVQTAIYFLVPLIVAGVHSFVSIKFITNVFEYFGETALTSNVLMVAGFVVLIYGGYFLATYIGGKHMIREH